MNVGALYRGNAPCEFVVWAPFIEKVELSILSPEPRTVPMQKDVHGYWRITQSVPPGTLYMYRLNNDMLRPDPASRFQPQGVHRPSQVVDHTAFTWTDQDWKGIGIESMVMYELHVGAFTDEGTFDAAIPRLPALKETGVTTLQIMPVGQFSGERNWGYDGVHPYAVQHSYGGPDGLQRFVNACHQQGMAVFLDVVYNHIGPEGNYLGDFAPYFTTKYRTPWGGAINFDGPHSDPVVDFFAENALYWFRTFHIDGLRLDAIHSIFDTTARPFLAELSRRTEQLSNELGRKFYLVAESNLNDPKIFRPREAGGFQLDAQWMDDFHNAMHPLLTGERSGYFADYGSIEHLAKCYREGYVLTGEYSQYRKRRQGTSGSEVTASRFVVCTKNHDQIGNRMLGERLPALIPFEGVKLSMAATAFSPYIPLMFMGEEYAEDAPFLYFVHHSDRQLIEAVRKGRMEVFKKYVAGGAPHDPQDVKTFDASKLRWDSRHDGHHATMLSFAKHVLELRRAVPALAHLSNRDMEVTTEDDLLIIRRWHNASQIYLLFNFGRETVTHSALLPGGSWKKTLDSAEKMWDGPARSLPATISHGATLQLAPLSASLFEKI